MRSTAKSRVLAALKNAGRIGCTTAQLCDPSVGGVRFGGRVKELRDEGHEIERFYVRSGSHRYVLANVGAVTPSGPQAAPETPEAPSEAAESSGLFDADDFKPKRQHDTLEAA